ncbi:MAG: hypothetical protein IJ568_01525 [Bacilli bacterium]|nr:hypothetical protein [Bacilli bacterium]
MRKINRINKKVSVFGEPNQQVYDYINLLKKEKITNSQVLIVDANDGKNVIPFAKYKCNVTCYEDDKILLYGGKYNNHETSGLIKRIMDYNISQFVMVETKNYYLTKDIKKYDFLYIEQSLNLKKNENISLKKKIKKLMSNVKEGGYIYIYYDLKCTNNDNPNCYLSYGEMRTFFDLLDWKIMYICERNKNNYCNFHVSHERKVGYILAMKKRNRRVHKNNYNIEVNNNILD